MCLPFTAENVRVRSANTGRIASAHAALVGQLDLRFGVRRPSELHRGDEHGAENEHALLPYAGCMIPKWAPAGSTSTANRPTEGTDSADTAIEPPSIEHFLTVASQSFTPK